MASPFVHLIVADVVAAAFADSALSLPQFLFGSTAPDVDKLGFCTREASHFWSFSEDVSGALKLLRAHPHLAADQLDPAARSFIAGYLCHLVADEQWMLTIYRPYFGRRSKYGGGSQGIQLQWALHFLLEARLTDESARLPALANLLSSADAGVEEGLLPFVSTQAVDEFRTQVLLQFALPVGLERAEFVATGRERASGVPRTIDERALHDQFLANLPQLMDQAASYVPASALEEFDRRAVEESVILLRDYLAGRPLQPPRGTAPLTSLAT